MKQFGVVQQGIVTAFVHRDTSEVAYLEQGKGVQAALLCPAVGGRRSDPNDLLASLESLKDGNEAGSTPVVVKDDLAALGR